MRRQARRRVADQCSRNQYLHLTEGWCYDSFEGCRPQFPFNDDEHREWVFKKFKRSTFDQDQSARILPPGEREVYWIERTLTHTKGHLAGKPIRLMGWQMEFLWRLYGTMHVDGTRQYRMAWCEVARKNAKSTGLGAPAALIGTVLDGEIGAENFSVAGTRKQASVVFDMAAQMVRNSEELSAFLKILESKKTIENTVTGSTYVAESAEAPSKHGPSPHTVVFDEVHVQRNRELWDAYITGMGSRLQALTLGLTTAGYDRTSLCWDLHNQAVAVIENPEIDPELLAMIYAADLEKMDWKSDEALRAANPGYGICIYERYLKKRLKDALQNPAFENTYKRLHLNVWTEQSVRWMQMERWDACAIAFLLEQLKGKTCYAGLDLASIEDIASLVLVFPPQPGLDIYHALPFFFIPRDNMNERTIRGGVPYVTWEREGLIFATDGNVIDYDFIEKKIIELRKVYSFTEIEYDQWNAEAVMQHLEKKGFISIKNNQQFGQMAVPTKELMTLVQKQKLTHGGNKVLRWMATNMVVKENPDGYYRPDKKGSAEKIDGIVALIMGLDRAMRHRNVSGGGVMWLG